MSGTESSSAFQCSLPEKALSDDQKELSSILKELPQAQDGKGISHFGEDGVLRALTADRAVIGAVALRPGLIKAFLDRHPAPFDQRLEDMYRGVDGTKVAQEQWLKPGDKVKLPPPPTEEELEAERQFLEHHADQVRAVQEAKERGDFKPCPVVVYHDYNLD